MTKTFALIAALSLSGLVSDTAAQCLLDSTITARAGKATHIFRARVISHFDAPLAAEPSPRSYPRTAYANLLLVVVESFKGHLVPGDTALVFGAPSDAPEGIPPPQGDEYLMFAVRPGPLVIEHYGPDDWHPRLDTLPQGRADWGGNWVAMMTSACYGIGPAAGRTGDLAWLRSHLQ